MGYAMVRRPPGLEAEGDAALQLDEPLETEPLQSVQLNPCRVCAAMVPFAEIAFCNVSGRYICMKCNRDAAGCVGCIIVDALHERLADEFDTVAALGSGAAEPAAPSAPMFRPVFLGWWASWVGLLDGFL